MISVAVKLDVFISCEPSLYEISKALKVSGFRESTLRLIVNKLDVTCLGIQNLTILLEQINPEVSNVSCKYGKMCREEKKLSPLLFTLGLELYGQNRTKFNMWCMIHINAIHCVLL